MRIHSIWIAAVIAGATCLWGCDSPGVKGFSCEKDSDCASGDQCLQHACVGPGSTGSSGSSGSTTGTTGTCTVQCGPGQYCVPNASGGTCSNIYTLSITSPAAGSFIDGGSQNAAVTVNAAGGRDGGLKRVELVVGDPSGSGCAGTPVNMDGAGSTWTKTYALSSASDKAIRACAYAHDASDAGIGSATPVDLHLDVTPPVVDVTPTRVAGASHDPTPGFQNAYVRDEAPLPFTSSAIDNGGSGIASSAVTLDGVAQTSPIDLGALTLNGGEQKYTLKIVATDKVGNQATKSVDVLVTRWKWVANVGSSPFMPAVDTNGVIYGVSIGNSVFSLDASGQSRWSGVLSNAPSSPPALAPTARQQFFVLTGSQMAVVQTSDGGSLNSTTISNAKPDFAVASVGGADIAAIGQIAGGRARVQTVDLTAQLNPTDSKAADSVSGVFASGSNAYLSYTSGSQSNFQAADLTVPGLTASGVIQSPASWGPIGTSSEAFFVSGLGHLGHASISSSISESPAEFSLTNTVDAEPLIPVAGKIILNSGASGLQEFDISGGSFQVSSSSTAKGDSGMLLATAHLYSASGSTVYAVDFPSSATDLGSVQWSIDLSDFGTIVRSPAIGCAQHSKALLLVPTNSGKLVALVVDDTGLRTSAPWPKARHDLFNSANASVNPTLSCP